MSEFGQRVRQRREGVGMSQEELAKKIALKSGKQTISRWEQGKSEPSLTEAKRIAEALNVTLNWLVDGEDPAPTAMSEPPLGYVLMSSQEVIDMQRKLIKQQAEELERRTNT